MKETAPQPIAFKKHDWVFDGFKIAKVKEVWGGSATKDPVFDLLPYNTDGAPIGRWHDAMGGPRGFEPCCSMEGWARIAKPEFPVDGRYGLVGTFVFLDAEKAA